MGNLIKKIRRSLRQLFPPPDRVRLRDEDGIIGVVVSKRFEGLESLDRINMIWDHLEKELTSEERKQIVIILAVTPFEEMAHTAI